MLMSDRIIPAIGEPPTPPSFTLCLGAVLPPLGESVGPEVIRRKQIEALSLLTSSST